MKRYKLFLIAVLFSAGLISCSDDDPTVEPENQMAKISVELTDAPGDYEEVNIQVVDVMVKIETETDMVEGWQSLGGVNAGIYDLLSLTGGVTQLLAESEVPDGMLTGMKLVLGSNNTVEIDGAPIILNFSEEQLAGLEFDVSQDLVAGEEYHYVMDFNVEESVILETESGDYLLEPEVRLFLESETGAIDGVVSPAGIQTLIVATNGATVVSTYTNSEGEFKLSGLPEGDYEVKITPDASSGLPVQTYNNVNVKIGETTTIGPVTLD